MPVSHERWDVSIADRSCCQGVKQMAGSQNDL